MQFELTLAWSFIQGYRDVCIDYTPYRELSLQYDHRQEELPKSVVCYCTLHGAPQPVRMTFYTTMPWARIQFEVDDATLGNEIRQKLLVYATENQNGAIYKQWHTRQVTNEILARHGLDMGGIQMGEGMMSRECIEELMQHFEALELHSCRRDVSWLFKSRVLPKPEQVRVAKWLVSHLAKVRNVDDGTYIVEQLYNEFPIREIADDLIRLLKDQNFKGRDWALFSVFARTKDKRVLEVALWLLDAVPGDNYMTQHALAAIGRRKAKQHVERVRPYLKHASAEVRREAKKVMKAIGFPVDAPPPPVHLVKKGALPKKLEEWSANLDMEQVEPVLKALAKSVESGFGAQEIAEVNGVLEEMKGEQTKAFRFPVTACGANHDVWLVIFMDDVDSPDLEIHSAPELIAKLEQHMPPLE